MAIVLPMIKALEDVTVLKQGASFPLRKGLEMNDNEMKAAVKIDRLLSQFRSSIDPNIPAQMLQTFMAVAMNEGKSLTEIADIVSANLSTASRHLLELGDRNRRMEPGYGLVARTPDPMNLRQNSYSLTPKGRLLLTSIIKIMEA